MALFVRMIIIAVNMTLHNNIFHSNSYIILIYSYTPESCLENDSYKLYFDRTILTDIHIKHNRPDIIIFK
jgi:hypothetical protein